MPMTYTHSSTYRTPTQSFQAHTTRNYIDKNLFFIQMPFCFSFLHLYVAFWVKTREGTREKHSGVSDYFSTDQTVEFSYKINTAPNLRNSDQQNANVRETLFTIIKNASECSVYKFHYYDWNFESYEIVMSKQACQAIEHLPILEVCSFDSIGNGL